MNIMLLYLLEQRLLYGLMFCQIPGCSLTSLPVLVLFFFTFLYARYRELKFLSFFFFSVSGQENSQFEGLSLDPWVIPHWRDMTFL